MNHSGALGENEIRTMVARLHGKPVEPAALDAFKATLFDCAGNATRSPADASRRAVTREVVRNCEPVHDLMRQAFTQRKR